MLPNIFLLLKLLDGLFVSVLVFITKLSFSKSQKGKDYGRDSCTAMPSIAINPYGQQPFTAFSDWSHWSGVKGTSDSEQMWCRGEGEGSFYARGKKRPWQQWKKEMGMTWNMQTNRITNTRPRIKKDEQCMERGLTNDGGREWCASWGLRKAEKRNAVRHWRREQLDVSAH